MTDCGGTCIYVARKEDPSNWHGKKPDDWVLDMDQPVGLEQKTWDCPHDALSDREYCAFHTHPDDLPAEIDEGELFVKAVNESSASGGKIARRKKEFVGATFGPLNIEKATLDSDDDHPIRLNHATFTAGIRADRAVFEHGIFATATNFNTSHQHISDKIKEGFLFTNAKFNSDSDLSFGFAEFNGDGDLSFKNAEFNGDGNLVFGNAEFNGDGDLWFSNAEFNGDGDLWFGNADFNGDGDLRFDNAEFNGDGDLWFGNAEFNGDGNLVFRNAEFNSDGNLSFVDTKFNGNGNLTFEQAEMSRPCDFIGTRFKSPKQVTFSGADIRESLIFEVDLEEKKVREVRENLDFSDAVISGELRFRESENSTVRRPSEGEDNEQERFDLVFVEAVDFSGTIFGQSTNFSSTQFRAKVDFSGATFKQSTNFSSTQFRAEVDFSGTTFEQPADFSSTQFLAKADFRHARVQNTDFQNVDLVGPENTSPAAFDKADLSGVNFSNSNLTGASFERAVLNRAELLGADFTRRVNLSMIPPDGVGLQPRFRGLRIGIAETV